MKKLCALTVFVLLALMELRAFADAMIPITTYKCLVCEKKFYAFQGDDLDTEELNDPDIQPKRVFTLADRGKNFPDCGSFKAHVFEQQETMLRPMSQIAHNAARIAVIRGGKNLTGITITEWFCMLAPWGCGCKWPVYTLNDERLNIKDWEQQPDKIVAIKGDRKIPKCQSKWGYGHAFIPKGMLKPKPVTSEQIATVAYDLFYVKN